MDEADRAQIEIEHALVSLVDAARYRVVCAAEPTGECLNCGNPLPPSRRWCDSGCRDDWTRLHPVRSVN